jgi:hypothetical protein
MLETLRNNSEVPAYEPGPELREAVEAMRAARAQADAIVDAATKRLHQAIADEVAKPTRPAAVARFLGWHATYVRRIAKAHGVEPFIAAKPPGPETRRKAAD